MSRNLRCMIVVLLSLASVTSAQNRVSRVAQKGTSFGLRLFQEVLADQWGKNLGFSPYGVTSALSVLQSGAAGTTLDQIRKALNYGHKEWAVALALNKLREQISGQQKSAEDPKPVHIADGLFVQRDLSLTPGFLQRFQATFHRHLSQVNFTDVAQAKDIINQWVENKTDGMIKDLVGSNNIPPLTRLVLLSAVHFSGKWTVPFLEKATHQRPFYRSDGSHVQVQMMANTGKYNCSEFTTPDGDFYDVIELPYEGEELSMLIAAPYEKNVPLSAITNILTPELIAQWKAQMKKVTRLLVLPKFSLLSEVDLKKPLERLGITDMFTQETADFSRLSSEKPLYVSEAFQKIKVEVTEKGTRASAATAAILLARMAPLEVIMDHPFLFMVRHNPTGTLLFVGQVMEP
ncbi:plasminogen activator inhibitor 1 [Xenopus tropicalis]|uniref:Plasminogen activator inhibitor 1 n=2 Tax=Xenopus tropicalis TaxID=8364 RepID=A0A1B8Y922_XENTR|nr:plasminogen activator inhibitor 1 [Xenopus tropicalis]|eukprot:XP_002941247.2 PREDICTED: plasminogen activator inhibitor 1 [Xenopus tropicalis]